MKLRFKGNSLRLRLNQTEVRALIEGVALRETISFPNGNALVYLLAPGSDVPAATLVGNVIGVAAPQAMLTEWAESNDIGVYLELPTDGVPLLVAIEKDLECVDGPAHERDAAAFPRAVSLSVPDRSC